jgi:hypothetical protein
MADNVAITAGSGTAIAADDIASVWYQRTKLSLGADGTAVDAVAGAGLVGTGVQRVTLASDDPAVVDLAAIEVLLTGMDADTDAIKTSVQLLDNAIAGTEMQVDIVAALPAGTNSIGEVTANAGTNLNTSTLALEAGGNLAAAVSALTAIAGYLDTEVAAIVTAVQLLDNVVSGSEAQVDIVAALPAGTNAIGKLAANSGVDIGDVDVTSISAGENHLGEVGGNTSVFAVTFSLDTSAYASGDVLADSQQMDACLRKADGSGLLQSVVLNDKDDQGQALDIVILSANVSIGTENSAVSVSDTDADNILAIISVQASDWIDLGGCRVASLQNLGVAVKAVSGTDDLYVALISRGTGTYTASGITARFGFLRD